VFVKVSGKKTVSCQLVDQRDEALAATDVIGPLHWVNAGDTVHVHPGYTLYIYNDSAKKCKMAFHKIHTQEKRSSPSQSSKRSRSSSGSSQPGNPSKRARTDGIVGRHIHF
jgi:hypothetical protein